MAKKKNTGDAMDTSMEETQGTEEQQPEGTEDQTQGKEEQLEGAQNDNPTPDGGAGQEDVGLPNTESAEHAAVEDTVVGDELDADMAAEVVAVKGLYEELTGGSKMPVNYNMGKVVRDAWATKKAGKPYPGYCTALRALTGVEVG